MHYKKFLFCGTIALLLSFLVPERVTAQSNSFYYTNRDYGIRMAYPSNWQIQQGLHGHVVTFISPREGLSDRSSEFFSITTEDLKPCARITLREYVQHAIYALKSLPSMIPMGKIIPITIDGLPGYLISYTFGYGSAKFQNVQAITEYANTAYIMTYSRSYYDRQFNNSLDTAISMIRTLKIGDSRVTQSMFSAPESIVTYVHHDPTKKCGQGSALGSTMTAF
jgi:hypothetical protein